MLEVPTPHAPVPQPPAPHPVVADCVAGPTFIWYAADTAAPPPVALLLAADAAVMSYELATADTLIWYSPEIVIPPTAVAPLNVT